MIGPHLVALSLSLLGSGARVDVAAATVSEVSAGRRPLVFDAPSRPAAVATTALPLGMRVLSLRTTFLLVYTPSLELQIPNAARTYRPLHMHQLASLYTTQLTRRTSFRAGALGAAGETSYGSLQNYFASGDSTAGARITRLASASGSVGTQTQTSRLNTLGWSLTGGYRTPLNQNDSDRDGSTRRTLPTSYDATLVVQDSYILTLRDGIGVSVQAGYLGIVRDVSEFSQDQAITGGDISWFRRLSLQSELTLTGGATVAYGRDTKTYSIAPTAAASHTHTFRGAGATWSATTSVETRGFMHRATATYRPRGSGRFSLSGQFGRPWRLSFYVTGSTSLANEPIAPASYESNAGAGQTTTYSFNSRGNVNFGVRAGLRGPHLSERDALRSQEDLAAFVGFRWNIGTDREYGSWL